MRTSHVVWLAAVVVVVVACGDGGSTQNDGGADAGTGSDGTTIVDVNVPDSPIPPTPTATCTPPITPPDTSTPTTVVGTGSAGTCTETALAAAIAKGGVITFSCGGTATITVTTTLALRTDVATTIDGGGKITIDGGGAVQIMNFNHPDYRKNTTLLTLMHLTLAHGKNHGTTPYAPAQAPCSQGFYDGYGGALFVRDGEVAIFDTIFDGNQAEQLGPDVGGGAISLQGVLKATIVGSTFVNGVASNGGGIESLNSEVDVYNSTFDSNVATGNGANSDDANKCSVVATNGQHQVGSGGNAGAIAIDGGSDGTHTFCGVVFKNNQAGAQALAGAIGRTPDAAKQTTIIDRCLFDGNKAAQGGGGALYFHNSTLQIHASTFHANVAKGCGAIQADGTTLDFVNDTFEGNTTNASGAVGGALCLFGGDGAVTNVTFANNVVDGFGAAIFGNPTLAINDSLFANNVGNNPGAPMQCQVTATGDHDLQFPVNHTNGNVPDTACVPNIGFSDPKLAAIGDNGGPTPTMLVQTGSPALALGQSCPATDQRGTTRPPSGCTSGATEGTK